MIYTLAVYTAVTLVTGVALLLVWRNDRTQAFTRLLGLSHVALAFNPLAYLAWKSPDPVLHMVGQLVMIGLGTAYIVMLIMGGAHLSHRTISRRACWGLVAGFCLFYAVIALAVSPSHGQMALAACNTVVGLILIWWLRRQRLSEVLSGVFIALCGLDQFTYVIMGEAGVELQTALASVLRVMLCLTLIYAAFERSTGQIRRLHQRFEELVDRSHQGVTVMRNGKVVYANPAFLRIYGLTDPEQARQALLNPWLDATVPEADRAAVVERTRRIILGQVPQESWEGERVSLDGRRLQLRFSAWQVDWDGQPAMQMVVTDDTERHDAMRALLRRATRDDLTGLPNRSALLQRLRELFADGELSGFVLVSLDVDRFKLFNDAHGHRVGDQVLQGLANSLSQHLHGHAEVMRLGEDEFALLAVAADGPATAERLTSTVRELLVQPLVLPEHQFFLDVSMGVAVHPSQAHGPEGLLQAANAAMHEAKRLPGTSVHYAQEHTPNGMGALLTAEQSLRAGIKNEEFTLLYQPKVDAGDHRLVGFEALVRWDRPGQGRISPLDFIPAAERTGLIVPLGALILTQACRQIAQWQADGCTVVPVAVNVSPLQLLDAGFPAAVMRTLAEFKVPPALLTLEITESAAVTHMAQARDQIGQLRQQGVEVALDDFGTGFSSLNMLRGLPLSTVKIDRSLIDPMPAPDAAAVVKSICDLAGVLNLEVVAEGVETIEHAAAALAAGCNVLQGYYFAKPLDVPAASGWLQGRR